jgi:hypothetical protein|tara:strand:- start:141 stop:359 length:219 start_codon:yes stop_codon:yes gene_type:complete
MSMKFLLILQVCSFLSGECKAPIEMPQVYSNWAECATNASVRSLELLQVEGFETVNKYRLAVKYSCYEITAL